MISDRHPTNSVTDSINSMDKLEPRNRSEDVQERDSFLLGETASKNAAFLTDKALGTSGRYEGDLSQGFSGVVIADCIGDARSAWRGCWRFGLQRSRAGRHKVTHKVTFQIFLFACSPSRYSQGFP